MNRFGELLLMNWNEEALTSATIARWFNNVASTLYEMSMQYENVELCQRMADYLKITESDVFVDDAVDVKMQSYESWGNADSVLIVYDSYTKKSSVTVI